MEAAIAEAQPITVIEATVPVQPAPEPTATSTLEALQQVSGETPLPLALTMTVLRRWKMLESDVDKMIYVEIEYQNQRFKGKLKNITFAALRQAEAERVIKEANLQVMLDAIENNPALTTKQKAIMKMLATNPELSEEEE